MRIYEEKMQSKIFAAIAASFVLLFIIQGEEASVVEREKREDNEWIVTTLVEKPYVIRNKDPAITNDDYEGFIPDLLKKIGDKLNQKYRIREVQDGKYGVFDSNRRSWSGLIGEVSSSKADLAAAPITISDQRSNYVDFTVPFMTFGTVVLLRNSSAQGAKTVHDLLSQQSDLRYGVVNDGSTEQLIRGSSDADLSVLQGRLDKVDKQDQGVARVRNGPGKFSFVIEEKTANFWKRQEPCDLVTIPVTQLDKRDYAFALKKGSPHTEKVSKVIQELRDNGVIEALERQWWTGPCSVASGTFGVLTLTLTAALGALVHSVKF